MSAPIEPTYDSTDLADALESAVLAFLRVPPIRQALHDLLRTYGIVAQSGEMVGNQHDQIQALAEAMTIFHAGQIQHERRAVNNQAAVEKVIGLLQTLADTIGDPSGLIAQAAAEALALLNAEADVQLDMIETEAARARTLLRIAQSNARADLADAVATAQTLRNDAKPGKETAALEVTDPPPSQTMHAAAIETAAAAAETASAAAETVAAAAETVAAAVAESAHKKAE